MINDVFDEFIEFNFMAKLITITFFASVLWFGVLGINGAIDIIEKEKKINIDIKRAAIINQSQQIYTALLFNKTIDEDKIIHLHSLVEREILLKVPVFENETWKINNSEVSLLIKNNSLCQSINKRLNDPIEKWDKHLTCERINDDLNKVVMSIQ